MQQMCCRVTLLTGVELLPINSNTPMLTLCTYCQKAAKQAMRCTHLGEPVLLRLGAQSYRVSPQHRRQPPDRHTRHRQPAAHPLHLLRADDRKAMCSFWATAAWRGLLCGPLQQLPRLWRRQAQGHKQLRWRLLPCMGRGQRLPVMRFQHGRQACQAPARQRQRRRRQ